MGRLKPAIPDVRPRRGFYFVKIGFQKNRSRKKTEIDKTAVYRTYNRAYNRKYNRTDSSQGLRVYVPAGAFIFSKSASKKKSTSGKIEIGRSVEFGRFYRALLPSVATEPSQAKPQ